MERTPPTALQVPPDLTALRREIETLKIGLAGRDVIGQAKGILMERFHITADEAIAWLKAVSQDQNRRVSALCEELAFTGEWDPTRQLGRGRRSRRGPAGPLPSAARPPVPARARPG